MRFELPKGKLEDIRLVIIDKNNKNYNRIAKIKYYDYAFGDVVVELSNNKEERFYDGIPFKGFEQECQVKAYHKEDLKLIRDYIINGGNITEFKKEMKRLS